MPTSEEMVAITVEARVIGQRRPLVSDWQVPAPKPSACGGAAGAMCLRDLLGYIVRQEVQGFQERQQERRLTRVLSPQQIVQAVAEGKVEMGGPRDLPHDPSAGAVDEGAAVTTALQAFEDGLFYVFLDERQQHDLDAEIALRPDSKLLFIRLVALAGG